MLRPVSDVLETAMLLANREQEIHSKKLSRRVLMRVLDCMGTTNLTKNQLDTFLLRHYKTAETIN
jgi:hypothetical protein